MILLLLAPTILACYSAVSGLNTHKSVTQVEPFTETELTKQQKYYINEIKKDIEDNFKGEALLNRSQDSEEYVYYNIQPGAVSKTTRVFKTNDDKRVIPINGEIRNLNVKSKNTGVLAQVNNGEIVLTNLDTNTVKISYNEPLMIYRTPISDSTVLRLSNPRLNSKDTVYYTVYSDRVPLFDNILQSDVDNITGSTNFFSRVDSSELTLKGEISGIYGNPSRLKFETKPGMLASLTNDTKRIVAVNYPINTNKGNFLRVNRHELCAKNGVDAFDLGFFAGITSGDFYRDIKKSDMVFVMTNVSVELINRFLFSMFGSKSLTFNLGFLIAMGILVLALMITRNDLKFLFYKGYFRLQLFLSNHIPKIRFKWQDDPYGKRAMEAASSTLVRLDKHELRVETEKEIVRPPKDPVGLNNLLILINPPTKGQGNYYGLANIEAYVRYFLVKWLKQGLISMTDGGDYLIPYTKRFTDSLKGKELEQAIANYLFEFSDEDDDNATLHRINQKEINKMFKVNRHIIRDMEYFIYCKSIRYLLDNKLIEKEDDGLYEPTELGYKVIDTVVGYANWALDNIAERPEEPVDWLILLGLDSEYIKLKDYKRNINPTWQTIYKMTSKIRLNDIKFVLPRFGGMT